MKRSLLPLNALRAFDAAARHMNFKRAADDLSVTPAAISQQIRTLEDFLGVELFKRSNRSLVLTEAGRISLGALQEGFEKLEEAVDAMTDAKLANDLRISVPPSFASKWMVPRLANYYERHPLSIVKISATMNLADFHTEDTDLAIRYGRGDYPGLHVEKLMGDVIYPVCSPDLAKSSVPIRIPADVLAHTLIHDESESDEGDTGAPSWRMWLRAAGLTPPDGLPALHFNTNALAIEAAVAGRGIALARSSIAEEDLRAGRLIRPFTEETPVDFAHYIVCPPEKLKLERVQQFLNWLRDEVVDPASAEDGADARAAS